MFDNFLDVFLDNDIVDIPPPALSYDIVYSKIILNPLQDIVKSTPLPRGLMFFTIDRKRKHK